MSGGGLEHTDRWLDVLFGMGDDSHPYWLMAVRVTILLFVTSAALVAAHDGARRRSQPRPGAAASAAWLLGLTALAAAFRFLVASPNLLDFGGIPYSRLLLGYKGHFAAAQFYSLFYNLAGRDIEHAILCNRIAGTLTIPLVYVLCRQLWSDRRVALLAALLFAVSPVHILFSASDALSIFTIFLCAWSYVLIAGAVRGGPTDAVATARWLGGLLGLVLLTQVRYENALFALPPAVFVWWHRARIASRSIALPAVIAAASLMFCLGAAAAAGLSYVNPLRVAAGVELAWRYVLWNPMTAAPVLALGCAAASLRLGAAAGALAMVAWLAALLLPVLAEEGHGAVRVYGSWLILLLPAAAVGFAGLLESPRRAARAAALAALAYLVALPLQAWPTLTSRYLEIREHEFFRVAATAVAARGGVLVVPDDEPSRRLHGTTLEVFGKYAMTLAAMPEVGARVRLAKLSDSLVTDRPAAASGETFFFAGLPCFGLAANVDARQQCEELGRARRLVPMAEATVVAAPFRDCAVYLGRLREELCAPTVAERTFTLYRVAGG